MEYRQLGNSGLKVSALSFGTATFGGNTPFFKSWGETDVSEAQRLIDICIESGVNFFDTADVYSSGRSEEILGKVLKNKQRDKIIVSTKATFKMGEGPNEMGSSRHHLIKACDDSLKRLGTDYIDIYFMHGFDGVTPIEETLSTLDNLIKSGKVRYIGCSNFSGWQVMKSLAISDKKHLSRYVSYQGYYSLIGREYEWELMPLALDQNIGLMVWSPLGWGRLTGKIRRDQPLPKGRIQMGGDVGGPTISDEYLYSVVDVLESVAKETGKTVPQIALNWLLSRPTVSNVVIGARNEEQLRANLGASGWKLSSKHIEKLDAASRTTPIYPYWHQMQSDELNPKPVKW